MLCAYLHIHAYMKLIEIAQSFGITHTLADVNKGSKYFQSHDWIEHPYTQFP